MPPAESEIEPEVVSRHRFQPIVNDDEVPAACQFPVVGGATIEKCREAFLVPPHVIIRLAGTRRGRRPT